jgi:DNA-binding MarR family transcriptional regulator
MSMTTTKTQQRDHVDRFLDSIRDVLPMVDLEVEGIVDRIGGLNRRFHRALDETLAEFDLDHAEWKLLGLLTRQASWGATPTEDDGSGERARGSSPGNLARMMELSSGAMTNRLDRLEEAGLVRRLPDPKDRRGIVVEVTEKGRRLYEKTVDVQAKKEQFFAGALTDAEKRQLNALLRRLMLEFERAEGGPPPEDCA